MAHTDEENDRRRDEECRRVMRRGIPQLVHEKLVGRDVMAGGAWIDVAGYRAY